MFDTHTHSCFSHDSSMTFDELCQAAVVHQLTGVTVTDHANLNRFEERNLLQNFQEMIRLFHQYREQYRDRLQLFCGIEIGEYLRDPEKTGLLLSLTNYDQIIAAIHYLEFGHELITFAAATFDDRVTDEEIYQYLDTYFSDLLKTAESFDFDVLAHITYPLRYINVKYERKIDIKCFERKIRQIFRVLIERGIALEVNTSRFQEKYGYYLTPDEQLLSIYRSMGGERITLGSDAHIPQNVGLGFPAVKNKLKDLGFENIYFFRQRNPEKVRI